MEELNIKITSKQEKERRNTIIFCTTIITGWLFDIKINDLVIAGNSLKELDTGNLKIAALITLAYMLLNLVTLAAEINLKNFKEYKDKLFSREIDRELGKKDPVEEERVAKIAEDIRRKVDEKAAREFKDEARIERVQEVMEWWLLITVPAILILLASVALFL